MMTGAAGMNTRILVIDDEESVRDSFRTVLCPRVADDAALLELHEQAVNGGRVCFVRQLLGLGDVCQGQRLLCQNQ